MDILSIKSHLLGSVLSRIPEWLLTYMGWVWSEGKRCSLWRPGVPLPRLTQPASLLLKPDSILTGNVAFDPRTLNYLIGIHLWYNSCPLLKAPSGAWAQWGLYYSLVWPPWWAPGWLHHSRDLVSVYGMSEGEGILEVEDWMLGVQRWNFRLDLKRKMIKDIFRVP